MSEEISPLIKCCERVLELEAQLAKKDDQLKVAKLYLDLIKDNDLHGGVNQTINAWELVDECMEKL